MVWFLSSLDNAQIDELDPDFMSFKFDLTFFNKSGIAFVVTIFNWPEIREITCFSLQNFSKENYNKILRLIMHDQIILYS